MNLCAQRTERHRDVSSSLSQSQPVMVTSQSRCHRLDRSRSRRNCEEERDVAVWKLERSVIARTIHFCPIPRSIQSPLAIAAATAEAERAEQKTLMSHKSLHHLFWLLGLCHCSLLRTGWRVINAHMGHTDRQSRLLSQAGNEAPSKQNAELRRLWKPDKKTTDAQGVAEHSEKPKEL